MNNSDRTHIARTRNGTRGSRDVQDDSVVLPDPRPGSTTELPFHAGPASTIRDVPDPKLEIQMLYDRILVKISPEDGERRSSGGIVIPATASVGRRLVWSEAVGVGQNVRTVEVGDRVLYDPEDRAEVEIHGALYALLRERDIHAVAASRLEQGSTGLYL